MEETPTLHYTLDLVVAFVILVLIAILAFTLGNPSKRESADPGVQLLVFGVPLFLTCIFLARPLRFGLAIAAVIAVQTLYLSQSEGRGATPIYSGRSYFGILRVKLSQQTVTIGQDQGGGSQTIQEDYVQLIHGRINHGMNFKKPSEKDKWGKPDRDFSRVATTYYHRFGPAGVVMEQYNWFSCRDRNGTMDPALRAPMNTYHSDARLPASLVGLGAGSLGTLIPFPAEQMVALWSEPPYATIGLGTGTMAAYSRPFQHMHYYEIDNQIKRLSLVPKNETPKFGYLRAAQERGAEIWVMMGDARLKMAQPYVGEDRQPNPELDGGGPVAGGGPDNFYHMMVVDAFTSDAIPVHLITKEAIKMYFEKLAPHGILCVHTSNRYVDLVPVVADVADSLGLKSRRGHDNAPKYSDIGTKNAPAVEDLGHFTSEWVMVARTGEDLERMKSFTPPEYAEKLQQQYRAENVASPRGAESYWEVPEVRGRNVWTDDYSNLMAALR